MFSLSVKGQMEEVVRLREDHDPPLTFEQIAQRMGFSERTARRRYDGAVLARAAETLSEDATIDEFPSMPALKLPKVSKYLPDNQKSIERFKPLTRTGDAVVTCDFHIPLHDPALVNVMINAASDFGIRRLIIAGDFFNMDQLSSYLPHQPEAALDVERFEGNLVMKTLLQHFDEVDFFWGNHDFRLTKKLGYKHSFTECMKWMFSELTEHEMSKIRFSDLDYMEYYPTGDDPRVKLRGQKFRICHPINFSSTPLTIARKLAQKHSCSIITAHSHHCAIGAAPNGVDICIEGGGFFAKDRTEYIQKTSTHHEWTTGFTIFKEGLPTLISPIFGNDKEYR